MVGTIAGIVTGNPFLGMMVYSLIAASGQRGNFGANFGVNFASSMAGFVVGAAASSLVSAAGHRSKTFDKIRREVEKPIKDFKIEALLPADDDFFANKKLVSDWSSYTREKGLLWRGNCRYNYLGRPGLMSEDLKRLANSGLFEVAMSIEAGDEGMRNRLLNKVLKDIDIIKGVNVMKESNTGIVVNTSFISYFPGDTEDNRIKMIKQMDYLSKNLNIAFSGPQVYRIYPGSKMSNIENDNIANDIRYYLDNLTFDGWLKSSVEYDEDELLFFSNVLVHFFTREFNIIEKSENNEVRKTNSKKHGLLVRLILSVLMVTVTVRLKTNFWRFFVEPRYIGKLYRLIRNISRFFNSSFNNTFERYKYQAYEQKCKN